MKYILTESQLTKLRESQEYLNKLLDKINDEGYDSLTNKEKDDLIRLSKGENVEDEPLELPVSDDVYDPNRMFLYYVEKYKEFEVNDLVFKLVRIKGIETIEALGQYHNFLIEPNFETNKILILDADTDEIIPVSVKNVPESTEGMRKLAVKFTFQILPEIIKKSIQ